MKKHIYMKWLLPVGESTDKDRGIGTAELKQPSVALLPQIKGFPTKLSFINWKHNYNHYKFKS